MAPPVIVLGVGRSGTTLLRVMLDRNSELAIPYESFFVPQLAHRHGRRPRLEEFLDDLGRLRTLYDWGIGPDDVRPRLREGMTTREAIAAIFETYAERQGKPRWGDKTPLYMQQLPLLERLFPDALWVHLVRDGRDAALSFLELPRGLLGQDVGAAAHGRAVRSAVADRDPRRAAARPARGRPLPRASLRGSRRRAGARAAPRLRARVAAVGAGMLDHTRVSDAANMPEHRNLAQPPTPGLRDWRSQMSREDALAFEQVAGDVLRGCRLRAARARRPLPDGARTASSSPASPR